jgi:hypothetical protein
MSECLLFRIGLVWTCGPWTWSWEGDVLGTDSASGASRRRSLPASQRQTPRHKASSRSVKMRFGRLTLGSMDTRPACTYNPTEYALELDREFPSYGCLSRLGIAMQRFQSLYLRGCHLCNLSLHGVFSCPSLASPKIHRHPGPSSLLSASLHEAKLSGSSS